MDALRAFGGVPGLARALGSDLVAGLAHEPRDAVDEHLRVYGSNTFRERPTKNFFVLCWENLQDPIILLLCAAALVSTVLGAAIPQQRAEGEWVEGIAIWVAVLLVIGVGERERRRREEGKGAFVSRRRPFLFLGAGLFCFWRQRKRAQRGAEEQGSKGAAASVLATPGLDSSWRLRCPPCGPLSRTKPQNKHAQNTTTRKTQKKHAKTQIPPKKTTKQ